jgi:hypothetical protein
MDISIVATIGFTTIAAIGIVALIFASGKKAARSRAASLKVIAWKNKRGHISCSVLPWSCSSWSSSGSIIPSSFPAWGGDGRGPGAARDGLPQAPV